MSRGPQGGHLAPGWEPLALNLKCDKCDITIIIACELLSLFGICLKVPYILKYGIPTEYKNGNFILRRKELYSDHFSKLRHHLYYCIHSSMCEASLYFIRYANALLEILLIFWNVHFEYMHVSVLKNNSIIIRKYFWILLETI